jgi:CubicO group peptidase (beta-lactamase class C family)
VKYWPEFARRVPAKASVTIRHVLSHRGGFPTGPGWLTTRFFPDRAALRRAMEEVPLRFGPGERAAYHPLNFGHVLGELVERASGRDCGQLLRDEVFAPLGLRDLFLGLPADPSLEARVAWCYNDLDALPTGTDASMDRGDPEARAAKLARRFGDQPELAHGFNRPETWRSVLPAAGAIGSARDLARVYAVLAQGGSADGVELCTGEGLGAATSPVSRRGELDATLGFAVRWGTGFHMGMYGRGSTLRTFGHAGMGGQIAFADPDRELAFAFLCNGELADDFLLWRYRLQSLAFGAGT